MALYFGDDFRRNAPTWVGWVSGDSLLYLTAAFAPLVVDSVGLGYCLYVQ